MCNNGLDPELRRQLAKMLPKLFRKNEVGKLTGGLLQPATLGWMERHCPPKKTIKYHMGRFTVYNRDTFLDWLEEYYGNFVERRIGKNCRKRVRKDSSAAGCAGSSTEGTQGA